MVIQGVSNTYRPVYFKAQGNTVVNSTPVAIPLSSAPLVTQVPPEQQKKPDSTKIAVAVGGLAVLACGIYYAIKTGKVNKIKNPITNEETKLLESAKAKLADAQKAFNCKKEDLIVSEFKAKTTFNSWSAIKQNLSNPIEALNQNISINVNKIVEKEEDLRKASIGLRQELKPILENEEITKLRKLRHAADKELSKFWKNQEAGGFSKLSEDKKNRIENLSNLRNFLYDLVASKSGPNGLESFEKAYGKDISPAEAIKDLLKENKNVDKLLEQKSIEKYVPKSSFFVTGADKSANLSSLKRPELGQLISEDAVLKSGFNKYKIKEEVKVLNQAKNSYENAIQDYQQFEANELPNLLNKTDEYKAFEKAKAEFDNLNIKSAAK